MDDTAKIQLLKVIKSAEISVLGACDDDAVAASIVVCISELHDAYDNLMVLSSRGTIDAKRFKKTQHNNTSGHKGVTFNKSAGKWQAKIGDGAGRSKHLGYFDTMDEAVSARAKAEVEKWEKRH